MNNHHISDNELLQRFVTGGFTAVLGVQLDKLRDYLENRSAETGLAAPLFVSEAITAVQELFGAHHECLQTGFINQLDKLVRDHLPVIQRGDPLESAKRAKQFREELFARVSAYDQTNTYAD